MHKKIGLWIDHRKAVVVIVSDKPEEVTEIISHMEKHGRFSSGESEDGSSAGVRDRQYKSRLNSYYEKVIAVIREGDSIQIYGPGEARGELEKRLEIVGLGDNIVRVGTVDEMTHRQIAAKIREYLRIKKAQLVR